MVVTVLYRDLQFDELEITVIPGSPTGSSSTSPREFENDFVIDPAVQFWTLDIGQPLHQLNVCSCLSLTQRHGIRGQTFPSWCSRHFKLKVQGHRGTIYTLRLRWSHRVGHRTLAFSCIPCEDVRSNSQNDEGGQCGTSGYTEISRTVALGTGFTDDMSSVSSYPVFVQEGRV